MSVAGDMRLVAPIIIDGDMTGCYAWEDPFIRNWHRTNMASDHPTEFPFSQYQILPIGRTMGNFTKSTQHYQSEVPDYRFLDTVSAPGHKASSKKYWGRDHPSNMSLRPFQFNTDSDGHMLSQSVDTSLNLYKDVPTDPIARQLFHEELTPTATTLPIPAASLNDHPLDNKARCRTCETIIGEHHVVTANSHTTATARQSVDV